MVGLLALLAAVLLLLLLVVGKRLTAARAEAARYRALTQNALAAYSLCDARGHFLMTSPAAARILGFRPSEVAGRDGFNDIHPDDQAKTDEWLTAVRAGTDQPVHLEFRLRHKDGTWRWLEARACNLLHDPAVAAIVIHWHDVTARRHTEEQLRRGDTRLREAQRIARLGCWELHLGTDAVWWSDELYALYGVAPGAFQPSLANVLERTLPEDRDRVRAAFDAVDRQEAPARVVHRVLRPDGKVVALQVDGVLERDQQGRPERIWGTAQDVTDRARAEQERRELDQRLQDMQRLEGLGVLAGGLAHRMNNLLTPVLGYADLLRRQLATAPPSGERAGGGGPSPVFDEWLQCIESSARAAAELCRQLLDYAGRGTFVVGPVDLHHVIHENEGLLRLAIAGRAVLLRLALAADLPLIEGDASQIGQVVVNLATNATEAVEGREGGEVVLSTGVEELDADRLAGLLPDVPRAPGRYVFLKVRDTGVGMSDEVRARMFEPFFTTRFAGRGLGLAAVQGIVRSHRGGIEVQTALGKGTTMTVWLPAAAE